MTSQPKVRFSDYRGYLLAAITHLAKNEHYWARTAKGLAKDASLRDEKRVSEMLDVFESIFRKSPHRQEGEEQTFSLHLRYAKRKKSPTAEGELLPSDVPPLTDSEMDFLISWVANSSKTESEVGIATQAAAETRKAARFSAGAAIVSAIIAGSIAFFPGDGQPDINIELSTAE